MADFGTSVALSFEVDDAELRAARDDIENELGGVSVGVDAGGTGAAVADGGLDAGTLTDLADERNDILDDILDELEGGTFGGGGGGAGGLPIPGFGGGDDGGGLGILEALGISSLAGGAGSAGGLALGGLGAGIASGIFAFGGFQAAQRLAETSPFVGQGPDGEGPQPVFGPGAPGSGGPLFGGGPLFEGGLFDGGGSGDTPTGFPFATADQFDTLGEPSPQFQALIERFDSAVSETPAWLSRLERTAQRLTSEAAPTPSESGPRARFAGRPSGSERGLSAAERAIFSGGQQPTGSGGTTVNGVPTGFQSVDGGRGGDPRDRAREARDRGQTSAEVTVNADVNLDNLEAELRRFREDVLNEVDRRLRALNGGPGR